MSQITAPLSVTIFIMHVRILRNWSYASVSAVFMPQDSESLLCPSSQNILYKRNFLKLRTLKNSDKFILNCFILISSADSPCKQFGPKSGPVFCWTDMDPKIFDIRQ